jgi:alkanesulfonate monooxygenase
MPLLEEAYRFAELVLPQLPVTRSTDQGIMSAWTSARDAGWKKNVA